MPARAEGQRRFCGPRDRALVTGGLCAGPRRTRQVAAFKVSVPAGLPAGPVTVEVSLDSEYYDSDGIQVPAARAAPRAGTGLLGSGLCRPAASRGPDYGAAPCR